MSQVDNLLPDHIKSSLNDAEVDSDGEINMDRVLFAKNTIRMDMKQIDKNLKTMGMQNKENVKQLDAAEHRIGMCTPAGDVEVQAQPLTPTANLKVLFNAMSPELRHRDEQKKESDDDPSPSNSQEDYQFETVIEVSSSQDLDAENKFGSSRKEKSLGLLCQKFLQKYPQYPKPDDRIQICLDEVAKELQVERRRIYDIVNVLESVEIVSRVAKNKYAWHGKTTLHTTLAKLKALGDSEGFGEQIQRLKDFEFNRELEEQLGRCDPQAKSTEPDFTMFGESSLFNPAALRKDKSLGIMSQKFLMLFLVSKPKTVNLDLSAKLLIGDANIDKTGSAKFKTKIRRLYDIANILTSLDLIRKVHVTEIRGRKPAFRYVGPDIMNGDELHSLACCSDGCHRPTSRHSMLDCIQNSNNAAKIDAFRKEQQAVAETKATGKSQDDSKLKFGRHTSFEQLCAVATVETNKMYASQPASPTLTEVSQEFSQELQDKMHAAKMIDAGSSVGYAGIHEMDELSPHGSNNGMPTKGFVRKKMPNKPSDLAPARVCTVGAKMKNQPGSEAYLVKTNRATPNGKKPTVIPLTKDQIDAVLRSLKVPIPISKDQVIDATTQCSLEENQADHLGDVEATHMKQLNEKTPVVTINTPQTCGNKRPMSYCDSIPLEKRTKLDFPSPSSEDGMSPFGVHQENVVMARLKRKISDIKPSPQRALHLAPEFANPPSTMTNMVPSGDAPLPGSGGDSKQKKIEIIIKESSNDGQMTSVLKTFTLASPVKTNGQEATVLHLPMVAANSVQIVQNSIAQVVHVPTFNPLTSNVATSAPLQVAYAYPSACSDISYTKMEMASPSSGRVGDNGVAIIRPIATKAVASPNPGSQIVAPQSNMSYSMSPSLLSNASGGFIPVNNLEMLSTIQSSTAGLEELSSTRQLSNISMLS